MAGETAEAAGAGVQLSGAVVVVTGGAKGIGAALARRFAAEGARVAVADLDGAGAATVAAEVGGIGLGIDVSDVDANRELVRVAEERLGPVDLFCANAGIGTGAGIEAPDELWQRAWQVNLLAHVHAARAVLPSMLARGRGHLLITASAAGLLTNLGDAPYTATKHAAVGLAEWLAITYGDRGIGVSCLCPQGVRTDLLMGGVEAGQGAAVAVAAQGVIEPEEVADVVVAGLREGRFLILPHPEVADYARRKVADPDRWLAGMRRLQARLLGGA